MAQTRNKKTWSQLEILVSIFGCFICPQKVEQAKRFKTLDLEYCLSGVSTRGRGWWWCEGVCRADLPTPEVAACAGGAAACVAAAARGVPSAPLLLGAHLHLPLSPPPLTTPLTAPTPAPAGRAALRQRAPEGRRAAGRRLPGCKLVTARHAGRKVGLAGGELRRAGEAGSGG